MASKTSFRYDIAFLRALAILAVVGYHLQVPYFQDGYIGVDIFFVLSGYLMTRIIVGGIDQGDFRFIDFCRRRLLRILPALLMLIVSFFILLYFLLGTKLYDFSRFALASSLFISNIYYYLSSGYFQPSSQLNFLLHTWSLSVEWQFYCIYPLLLVGFRKLGFRKPRDVAYLLSGLFLLSLCCMFYSASRDQSFTFYMLHTRAWEFLAGGLVFVYEGSFRKRMTARVRNVAAIGCGLLLAVAVTGLLDLRMQGWPSAWSLVPVAVTSVLLLMQSDVRLFRLPPVKFIADISYSWYLWHWPLIVLAIYLSLSLDGVTVSVLFLLSLMLGFLSYRFAEKAIFLQNPKRLIIAGALVSLMAFLGVKLPLHNLFINQEEANLVAFQYSYPREQSHAQFGTGKAHLSSRAAFADYDTIALLQFSDEQPNYLLLGDCHAGMFAHTLHKLAQANGIHLLQATGDDCFPAPDAVPVFPGPSALMQYIYDVYLPAHHQKIDKVILSADYAGYSKERVEDYIDRIERYFEKWGIPVVYIGQTEGYRVEYPTIETLRLKFGIPTERYLKKNRTRANSYLNTSSIIADRYIDVYRSPVVETTDGKESYMYSADHFSIYGTEQYAGLFERYIFTD